MPVLHRRLAGPAAAALNTATLGASGALIGTALGVGLNLTEPATSGSLVLGAAVSVGSGLGFGALSLSSGLNATSALGVSLVTAGSSGLLTTVAFSGVETGIYPAIGATVGGVGLAAFTGVVLGVVESVQTSGTTSEP